MYEIPSLRIMYLYRIIHLNHIFAIELRFSLALSEDDFKHRDLIRQSFKSAMKLTGSESDNYEKIKHVPILKVYYGHIFVLLGCSITHIYIRIKRKTYPKILVQMFSRDLNPDLSLVMKRIRIQAH